MEIQMDSARIAVVDNNRKRFNKLKKQIFTGLQVFRYESAQDLKKTILNDNTSFDFIYLCWHPGTIADIQTLDSAHAQRTSDLTKFVIYSPDKKSEQITSINTLDVKRVTHFVKFYPLWIYKED